MRKLGKEGGFEGGFEVIFGFCANKKCVDFDVLDVTKYFSKMVIFTPYISTNFRLTSKTAD